MARSIYLMVWDISYFEIRFNVCLCGKCPSSILKDLGILLCLLTRFWMQANFQIQGSGVTPFDINNQNLVCNAFSDSVTSVSRADITVRYFTSDDEKIPNFSDSRRKLLSSEVSAYSRVSQACLLPFQLISWHLWIASWKSFIVNFLACFLNLSNRRFRVCHLDSACGLSEIQSSFEK